MVKIEDKKIFEKLKKTNKVRFFVIDYISLDVSDFFITYEYVSFRVQDCKPKWFLYHTNIISVEEQDKFFTIKYNNNNIVQTFEFYKN